MKKLLLFVFATLAFAACTQDVVVDITPAPIVDEVPETLVVGFEGDDTRIQLNEAQKTVWTEGDQVSVFYKSYDNLKFEFEGNTGDRNGTLKRVGGQHNGQTMDDVVVVYPYSADYMITLSDGCVNATIPSTQTYLKGSYGVGDNLMIARSSFNQFSLKSVCGWLKIQLTGAGEVIERITFRGNNGEQVAGLVYVDATTAEVTLATAKHNSDDNSQLDGTLVLDDSIYTEVTLDCSTGVTLGAEAIAFYIAVPPQIFEKGLTVDVTDNSGYTMTQTTEKSITIARNTIQPMAAFEVVNPAVRKPANNEIWYTSSDGKIVTPFKEYAFGATIVSNTYIDGRGVITFDGEVTNIGDSAFYACKRLTEVTIPDSVTNIGKRAFCYCECLTQVEIPDSVATIGDQAFYECSSLTQVIIGNGVTTIGEEAFYWCSSLTQVTIGDSVTTIGSWAFGLCDGLKQFIGKFAEDNGRCLIIDNTIIAYANASGNTYTVPDSVTTIGESAFYYCNNLTQVIIPNSITTIGDYAFGECTSLTRVTIPDSVTTIGEFAFSWSPSLTQVTIGNSVATLGDFAFYGCNSLKYVYCKATTPPALGDSYVFDDNASGRRIIVPIGSGEAYKKASYWSEYADSIFEDEF